MDLRVGQLFWLICCSVWFYKKFRSECIFLPSFYLSRKFEPIARVSTCQHKPPLLTQQALLTSHWTSAELSFAVLL